MSSYFAPLVAAIAFAGPGGAGSAPRPHIVQWPIPFSTQRKREMAASSNRHYGSATARLREPHVIVEHITASSTAQSAFNTFASDVPDSELHELPGTCSHFLIDRDGTIFQLVPLTLRCRHTVGLNWTAIGIEHVATTDEQVLGDQRQLLASLRLTAWLRCRFSIKPRDVIGHNESLGSPYHHELVARLRKQTHGDMRHASMVRYRRLLATRSC
jgi:N-acetylmuramoyl-L-alanine amidase